MTCQNKSLFSDYSWFKPSASKPAVLMPLSICTTHDLICENIGQVCFFFNFWVLFIFRIPPSLKMMGTIFSACLLNKADFTILEIINVSVISSLCKKNKPELPSWTCLNLVQTLKNAKRSCVKVQWPLWQSDCRSDFWHASFVCWPG